MDVFWHITYSIAVFTTGALFSVVGMMLLWIHEHEEKDGWEITQLRNDVVEYKGKEMFKREDEELK